ncbi:hypothetical protein LF1_03360 [Rubripirellula obstinata]|uniref:Chromo domain-containing protein n=1 Tax=Rubripirellula obstinata TaxID=406547 RepID=A0A5B1CBB0_9BACT|nr:DUF481 domain-containing protein [Rubripirellula obstinata]KAA1257846.1 hypothetical protein LF1_03360 [Rubripirellula obstinata]
MQRAYNHWTNFPILWTLWLVLSAWTSSANAGDSPLPLWQQGVSTFNGTGYVLPETDAVASPPANTGSYTGSYTMPVDPTQQIQAVAGYSDLGPSLNSPTLPPPIPSYTTSEIADLQGPDLTFPSLSDPKIPAPVVPDSIPDSANTPIGSGAASDSKDLSSQLNAQLDSAAFDGPAPLDQEVIRWYQYPRRWTKGWDSHAEFGLDGSEGNADTLAIQTGIETKRKTELYTFALDLDYRQATSRGVTTEENGRLNLDYDRMIRDSKWAAFGKFGLEWDTFKAFDLRVNMNGGLGYHWIRSDTATLVTRFGAGASREFGSPIDEWTPEGVFGIEAERQLTERQKLKGKLDYFPSWADFGDYRIVADASWEILLDGSENFSLKLSATDRYDSTPQGALANDLYYSLLLLYKF